MNKARRQKIEKAIALIEEANSLIECVKDEEEASYSNLPEGLQMSERGEQMEENVDSLDEVICYIDNALVTLDDVMNG